MLPFTLFRTPSTIIPPPSYAPCLMVPFSTFRIPPPLDDAKLRARYGRAASIRAKLTPHHLPHTIITDMLRERASREEVVSVCPMVHRFTHPAKSFTNCDGKPLACRTGDCMYRYLLWCWVIDEVRYDHYHECFVARCAGKPPAYLSPELAVWAIITWTEWGGSGYLSDVHYAEWLAWHRCKPWKDVVARLESHGEVAAGAAASVAECHDVFEAPEPTGGAAAHARILMWPHAPAVVPSYYNAGRHVGDRDGPWPPAAPADHCLALSSSCPPSDPPTQGRSKAGNTASIAGDRLLARSVSRLRRKLAGLDLARIGPIRLG